MCDNNVSDYLPRFQGVGRGGDGLFDVIPGAFKNQLHPLPHLPLEGEGTIYLDAAHASPGRWSGILPAGLHVAGQSLICSIVTVFIIAITILPARAGDVAKYLKKADSFRLEADAMQVETEVKLFKSGKLDKERLYTVYLRNGRRSLVLMQSAGEKGQKVLMLGDDFWQIMPQSQRPIRITPMQKLLGDASVGDIATMNWNEDYDGTVSGEADVDGVPCLHLSLAAKNKGASYKRIELFIARNDSRPVKADLYVASDKLAKQARFTVASVKGRQQVTAMAIKDQIQTGRETVISYLSRKARSVPDEYYNPMFLTRNDVKE